MAHVLILGILSEGNTEEVEGDFWALNILKRKVNFCEEATGKGEGTQGEDKSYQKGLQGQLR